MTLAGMILKHRDFGLCKVTEEQSQAVLLKVLGQNRQATYAKRAVLTGHDFERATLQVGLRCLLGDGRKCTIVAAPFSPPQPGECQRYTVEFLTAGRETAQLPESDLWPIPQEFVETPETVLASLDPSPFSSFLARERFKAAMQQLKRDSGGISGLASSRIALLPHQAFVVGTVVEDVSWRYVLADEVGLGKTIEAGAIAHQLLSSKPNARVLILTPGALSRQWLVEMTLSFGGSGFHLFDLYPDDEINFASWTRVICSIKRAATSLRDSICALRWDLVIVDEAHHLLWSDEHYRFVESLSILAGGVLLLSAVPARERAEELLRLLQLVDPAAYAIGRPMAERFAELYAVQADVGRRLRILSTLLERPCRTAADRETLRRQAKRLVSVEVIREDADLAQECEDACSQMEADALVSAIAALRDHVVDGYRVSRRLLKNRRAQLVEASLLSKVQRKLVIVQFAARSNETSLCAFIEQLLYVCAESAAAERELHALFRKLAPALCDPVATMEVLAQLMEGIDSVVVDSSPGTAQVDGNAVLDYEEHYPLLEFVAARLGPSLHLPTLKHAMALTEAWRDEERTSPRIEALFAAISALQADGISKIVVFAGTYGAAEFVHDALAKKYGGTAVGKFCFDASDDAKEKVVTRFRRDVACRFLVSDESGGEGRNFQFAGALVHFDVPWSVAAIEQRIGRLDRIGREGDVLSIVIVRKDSLEEAWCRCLADGFQVFSQSISGLEFMLRETERNVIGAALRDGAHGVVSAIAAVREASLRERETDDADALTDAASNGKHRGRLRPVSRDTDLKVEEAFTRYFLALANHSSAAKQIPDRLDPNLRIWRFRPDEITGVPDFGMGRNQEGVLPERYGTFIRSVARERRDLEFFAPGNALFDAVASVSNNNVRGRTFAIDLCTELLPAGLFLAAIGRYRPSMHTAHSSEAGISRARDLLSERRVYVLIDLETGAPLDGTTAERLFQERVLGGTGLSGLGHDRLVEAMNPLLSEWPTLLRRYIETVKDLLGQEYAHRYSERDGEILLGLIRERDELTRADGEVQSAFRDALQTCIEAFGGAKPLIDVLGIVRVLPAS